LYIAVGKFATSVQEVPLYVSVLVVKAGPGFPPAAMAAV